MTELTILAATLASATFLVLSFQVRRSAKLPLGFFQAGRNIGSAQLSGTYVATSLALANAVFYFLWLGYTAGLTGLWIQFAWCLGFVFLRLLLPKMLRESGTYTFHAFLAKSFGKSVGLLAAIVSFVGIGLNLGYEIVVGSTLAYAGWPGSHFAVGVFAASMIVIVGTYCFMGGFTAVIRTDSVQCLLSSLALVIAFMLARQHVASSTGLATFHANEAAHFSFWSSAGLTAMGGYIALLSNLAFSLPWQLCDMTSWQKLSACDPQEQKQVGFGVLFSGAYLLFVPGFLALMIGVYLRGVPGAEDSLFGALLGLAADQPLLLFLMLVGFISAMVSTADTFLIGAVQAFAIDIWDRNRQRTEANPSGLTSSSVVIAKRILWPVAITFPLLAWGYWSVNDYNNDALFTIVYVVYSMQLSLVWVMLSALVGASSFHTKRAGICSIGFGAATNLVLLVLAIGGFWGDAVTYMPFAVLIASGIGLVIGIQRPKKSVSQN